MNFQIWAQASREHGRLWRTFLAEQRALLHELDDLTVALPLIRAPVLLLADPADAVVPVETAYRLVQALPHARLQLVAQAGHHLPRRAADMVASAVVTFIAGLETADAQARKRSHPSGGSRETQP